MKKRVLFLGMFVLTLVLSSLVFSCDPSQVIFSLYSNSNSHVSSHSDSDYLVKACYSEFFAGYIGDGNRDCDGKPAIFYKAYERNSHVSLTSSEVYNIPVCYGDLICEGRTGNCLEGEVVLARLSSSSNAHVSLGDSDSNYPIKICCKRGSPDYISQVSSAKWVDFSSGEEVSKVPNGTKVNLSFAGSFKAGDIFGYEIYARKNEGNGRISSGTETIQEEGSFSSISFNALWDKRYLIEDKTVYFFKIIGKEGSILKESGDLLVDRPIDDSIKYSPAKTEIISPKAGEVYLIGDRINLSWKIVSGNAPIKNITYRSEGADINETGKDILFVEGSQNELLALPLFLKYSVPGQKKITLTTVDSTGDSSSSDVYISIAKAGVNVFALINKPGEGEKIEVPGGSNNLVQFNSSESYVYNYSDENFFCLAGNCPSHTSSKPPKQIDSSRLNEGQKGLKVPELYFIWTWRESTISFHGNGTAPNMASPKKGCAPGNDEVFLNLSYGDASQKVSNRYAVLYDEEYCFNGFVVRQSSSGEPTSTGKCTSQSTGDCCREGFECIENTCNPIVVDEPTTSEVKMFCSDFNSSKLECEGKSPNKAPIANRSFDGKCGKIIPTVGAEYIIYENCTCVWEESKCKANATISTINNVTFSPLGNCLIDTISSGSCGQSGGVLTISSTAEWKWAGEVGSPEDPRVNECRGLGGESVIPCPTRVQLSFFGVVEFIVAIILIALIYFIIKDVMLKRKSSEEKSKPKKVSKKKVAKKKK